MLVKNIILPNRFWMTIPLLFILLQFQCIAQDTEELLLEFNRNRLVNQLTRLEDSMTESAFYNDQEETYSLLKRMDDLWPRIVNLSIAILNRQPDDSKRSLEITYQNQLRNYASKLLYIGKVRNCVSPDETFFGPVNSCVAIGESKYCPTFMKIFDGPGNVGICDCSLPNMIYSNTTQMCYVQNLQGPCRTGEWFILNNNSKSECQSIPSGCQADGQHVYWSNNSSMPKQCWKIGSRGPCSGENETLQWKGFDVACMIVSSMSNSGTVSIVSPQIQPPCPIGTYRSQFLKCPQPFIIF